MAWLWHNTTQRGHWADVEFAGDMKERWKSIREEIRRRAMQLPPHPAYGAHLTTYSAGVLAPMPDRPLEFEIRYPDTPLPKMFGCLVGNAISTEVRDALDALEPGVHQYIPLRFTNQSGREIDEEFWMLNIGQRLDTCSPADSQNMWERISEVRNPKMMAIDGNNLISRYSDYRTPGKGGKPIWEGLACHASRVAGHHLWREYKMHSGIMMSDVLFEIWSFLGVIKFENKFADFMHPVREV